MRVVLNGSSLGRTMSSLLITFIWILSVTGQSSAPPSSKPQSSATALKIGQPIEQQIAGGQTHSYKVAATANNYLQVVVEQKRVDVLITLYSPDGKKLMEVDNPNGSFGPETLRTVTDVAGEYRIDVRTFKSDAASGAYEIKLQQLRSATESDKTLITKLTAAADARTGATEIRNKGGSAAYSVAIEAYQKALVLWREGGDKYWEASSLNDIGDMYYELDKNQQALDYYNQALSISESIGAQVLEANILDNIALVHFQLADRQKAFEFYQRAIALQKAAHDQAGEASSLHSIGNAYYEIGDKQKALESYNSALALRRELDDRRGQATLLNNIGLVTSKLGDNQKALDLYNQALVLRKDLNDQAGEATTLKNLGDLYFTTQEFQKALDVYNRALTIRRTVGGDQVQILNMIGLIYNTVGEKRKSLDYFNQVLVLAKAKHDRGTEALMLNNLGSAYDALGEKQKALELFNQALPIFKEVGDRNSEARCYSNIGLLYYGLGDLQKALEFFNRALESMRLLNDRIGHATTLTNIGGVYIDLGERKRALEYFNQALPIWKAVADRRGEAATLNNIGHVYHHFGEKEKALDYYKRALSTSEAIGDRSHSAIALTNISTVYLSLGEMQKALTYYAQVLPVLRELGDRSQEATTLINMGSAHHFLHEEQKALEFYNQGLAIELQIGDRRGEGSARNAIGLVYDTIGEKQKALEYYEQALTLWRGVGDRGAEATALGNIASTYFTLGATDKASTFYLQSLPLARAVGDLSIEATMLNNLMFMWKEKSPALATFYGKQAVNLFQQLRGNIKGLEQHTQKTFLQQVQDNYRLLANLLINLGRLPEAQQILGMLKEEEFFEFVRRDAGEVTALSQRADLTAQEQKAFTEYASLADKISAIAKRQGELKAKLKSLPEGSILPPAEQAEYEQLSAQLETANKAFTLFLDRLSGEFSRSQQSDIKENRGLQRDLKAWGPGTVALYTIVGEDRYRVIMTTANTQVDGKTEIRAADLNKKVLAFREAVQNPKVDPRPLAQELYNILIKPIEKQLKDAQAKTLVWSLDGTLRYLPLPALFDGQQYMAEIYQQAIITLASRTRLSEPVNHSWHGLGLGVSEAKEVSIEGSTERVGFKALSQVPAELHAIIRDENAEKGSDSSAKEAGVLPGRTMLNKDFTASSFAAALGRNYSLVHIASHFNFRPGDADKSFLLLGDGNSLTLEKVRTSDEFDFQGVELITLSACNTGVSMTGADGKEVEGFGAVAQERGAKAVLATLWPVADESTRELMTGFYRIYATTPNVSKAEALREAQLSLLHGAETKASDSGDRRSSEAVVDSNKSELQAYKTDPHAPFSHPYYWAPFILIGNWR